MTNQNRRIDDRRAPGALVFDDGTDSAAEAAQPASHQVLTDEQIYDIAAKCDIGIGDDDHDTAMRLDFARAVLRAAVSAATKPTTQDPVAWAVVENGKRVYVSCNKRAAEDWLPYSIDRELVELFDHPAATKPTADLPDENECWVHIYPSDLKRMERTETHATVFSVAVGNASEKSVPLYTAEQVQSLLATKPAADASMLRDMLAIQEACGLHTDEYAPGSVIEYIKELEADAATKPAAQAVPEGGAA